MYRQSCGCTRCKGSARKVGVRAFVQRWVQMAGIHQLLAGRDLELCECRAKRPSKQHTHTLTSVEAIFAPAAVSGLAPSTSHTHNRQVCNSFQMSNPFETVGTVVMPPPPLPSSSESSSLGGAALANRCFRWYLPKKATSQGMSLSSGQTLLVQGSNSYTHAGNFSTLRSISRSWRLAPRRRQMDSRITSSSRLPCPLESDLPAAAACAACLFVTVVPLMGRSLLGYRTRMPGLKPGS